MNIELAMHNYKITWPRYDRATHQEIVRRLKTISGAEFERDLKCWWVPVAQGAKLLELFWRASFSVDAICAAIDAESDRVRRFHESLRMMDIELRIEAERIVAVGEGVSPLIQTLVDERTAALLPLVAKVRAERKPRSQPAGPVHGPWTAEDAKFEPLVKGIQNAKQKAKAEELRYPRRRRKRQAKQGELGLENIGGNGRNGL